MKQRGLKISKTTIWVAQLNVFAHTQTFHSPMEQPESQ